MATIFIRHQVADYPTWRKVYDSVQPMRDDLGVTAASVYQSKDNPNDVTVTHDFATDQAAAAFGASHELREAMHEAGVVGAPTIWVADRA